MPVWKVPGSSLVSPLQVLESCRVSLKPSFFQAEQSQLSQPVFLGEFGMIQPCDHLDSLQQVHNHLMLGAPGLDGVGCRRRESPPSTCCLEMVVLVHFATSPLLLCYSLQDSVLEPAWFGYWYNNDFIGEIRNIWWWCLHVCLCFFVKTFLCALNLLAELSIVWEKDKGLEIAEFLQLLVQ